MRQQRIGTKREQKRFINSILRDRHEESIAYLKRVKRKTFPIFVGLGGSYVQMKHFDSARASYLQAILLLKDAQAIYPDCLDYKIGEVDMLNNLGDTIARNKALDEIEKKWKLRYTKDGIHLLRTQPRSPSRAIPFGK